MSISIYYSAERDYCLSEKEKEMVDEVINKYSINSNEEMDWKGEDFCIYEYESLEFPTVFQGATKIGYYEDDYEREIEEVLRWCYCLTEIKRILKDANWTVSLDNEMIKYDEKIGFYLPGIPKLLHIELKPDLK
ncbi:hypothetical protein [Clostridium lundense]|uniref:hypothetical protein n=1 Tax=Clostridium lundense TaxID=319475 RepID=UPI00048376C8|nr:hypothetical protein [Clostridium lundense]